MEHPNKSGFQKKKKSTVYHRGRWNLKGVLTKDSSSPKVLPPKTAVTKHQGLSSPRKTLGPIIIWHLSTQLAGALPLQWNPKLLVIPTS